MRVVSSFSTFLGLIFIFLFLHPPREQSKPPCFTHQTTHIKLDLEKNPPPKLNSHWLPLSFKSSHALTHSLPAPVLALARASLASTDAAMAA